MRPHARWSLRGAPTTGAPRRPGSTRRAIVRALVVAVTLTWVLGLLQTLQIGLRQATTRGGLATEALVASVPDLNPANSRGVTESTFDATYLNNHRTGVLTKITFVGATEPSNKSSVISVNPIDETTWGAAAMSSKNQICYLILVNFADGATGSGWTHFGSLPRGVACTGASVTKQSVTAAGSWPAEN